MPATCGINFLMNIDSSFASEVTAMERLDLSDIMELQLRRAILSREVLLLTNLS